MNPRLAAPAGAVLLLLAGCATTATAPPATPGAAPTAIGDGASGPPAAAGGPATHTCTRPKPAATVTDAEDGDTVCLTVGGTVTLTLRGSGWQTPVVQGDILSADPAGTPAGTRFVVRRPGAATITSARPNCPTTGSVRSCHSLRAFQVHVIGIG